jgi:hypothetical protein
VKKKGTMRVSLVLTTPCVCSLFLFFSHGSPLFFLEFSLVIDGKAIEVVFRLAKRFVSLRGMRLSKPMYSRNCGIAKISNINVTFFSLFRRRYEFWAKSPRWFFGAVGPLYKHHRMSRYTFPKTASGAIYEGE